MFFLLFELFPRIGRPSVEGSIAFQVAETLSVRFNTAEAIASSSFIGVRINETVQATACRSCCPGTPWAL